MSSCLVLGTPILHNWEAPPAAVQTPLGVLKPSAALNIEGVLGALGTMFSVPLGDSGPQMETDPLFKGRHQIPHRATDHSRQGAGTCQPEPVGLGEPELRPALMPCY